jgi:hypothetical protein
MAYKLIEAAQSRRRAVNASAASSPTTPGRARLCWREIRERHTRRMPRHRIQFKSAIEVEVVPGLVELEVAVPRLRPAVW